MKANKFFLGLALVGAILTACNKEPEQVTGPTGDAYVSVQISMASTVGTRATDGGFHIGEANEQKIFADKSIFLFYDEDGKWVTSGQLITETPSTPSTEVAGDHGSHEDGENINDLKGSAYIVLSGPDEELSKSTQVLTVVNYSNVESLKQLDLNQVLIKITNTTSDPANDGFLMTTSAYMDDATIVNTTAITKDNICETQAEALAAPVKIYIERASAKAEFTTNASDNTFELTESTGKDKDVVVDGEIKNVKVKITGWTLNNVNEETYLVKQLDATWANTATAPFNGWNWKENFRSFWAMGTDWDNEVNVKEEGKFKNTVYTFAQANKGIGTTMYCYENTVETPAAAPGTQEPNVNTVLIAAEFTVDGVESPNFYKYGGVFYTENNYKNLILKQIQEKGYKKAGGSDFEVADLTITTDSSLAGIQFTIANSDGDQLIDEKNVNDFVKELPYVQEVEGYAGGKCYYQIPVEHLGTTGSAQYGMVRNHYYKINVSAIKRIGEAVYNPNVIIPDIPEETLDYYLAAEIHVLSWHVVEQDVEL